MDGRPTKAPHDLEIIWCPPPLSWLKVYTNGLTFGGPCLLGYAGVFRTCRGFVNGCFAIPLDVCFAFKVELAAAVHVNMSSLLVGDDCSWRATQLTWWLCIIHAPVRSLGGSVLNIGYRRYTDRQNYIPDIG